MAGEVLVDALPYIDQGYDEPGVREAVIIILNPIYYLAIRFRLVDILSSGEKLRGPREAFSVLLCIILIHDYQPHKPPYLIIFKVIGFILEFHELIIR